MKKLAYSVAVSALAAFMATSAAKAADIEPIATSDWTGFHVGVGGGGNFVLSDDDAYAVYGEGDGTNDSINDIFNNANYVSAGFAFSDLGKAGAFGTAEIGYDHQMDNIVFGVLANYDFGKTKIESNSMSLEADNLGIFSNGTFSSSLKVGDSWAVGGRLGFLATESTLLYALGGYTMAKVSQGVNLSTNNSNNFATNTNNISFSDSSWEDGYFVGAGVETMLTDSVSIKGEYRFADFGKVSSEVAVNNTANNFGFYAGKSSDLTVHSVRAVLSFKF